MPELLRVDRVPSTMELAHRMARDGAEHGAAVIAAQQSGARGTRGRSWSSDEGGLWFSVVIRPPDALGGEVLPLRLGLALATLLGGWDGALPPVMVKWPNDLQIAGRKTGGILCEAHWRGTACQWIVAGVGINVSNVLPSDLAAIATRLADHAAADLRLEALGLAAVATVAAEGARSGALTDEELARWQAHDALAGRRIEHPLPGTALGVTPLGALRVRGDDGAIAEARAGVARSAL